MTILSDTSIKQAISSGELSIDPFHSDALEPASYDMRLFWKLLVSPTRYERGREVDLRDEKNHQFYVEPGRFVGVLTEEKLRLPLSMSGRFGLRSEFTRHGLVAFGGIQIDPGFQGRLAISLFHSGPEPIKLKYKQRMFTVEFHFLDQPASSGYKGQFQNQNDFHKMQREFILNAHTTSLSEINQIPDEIAGLERRFILHETLHHPHQEAFPSIADLANAQGVEPLTDLGTLSGVWPEDENIDDFLTSLQQWRRV